MSIWQKKGIKSLLICLFAERVEYPDEALPAYSVVAPHVATSSAPPYSIRVTSEDDKYAFLSTFDTIFVVNDSDSMAGHHGKEVAQVLRTITPICTAYDKDGIGVYVLNHRSTENLEDNGKPTGGYYRIDTPEKAQDAFQNARPTGATPIGSRLWSILSPYIARLDPYNNGKEDIEEVKPLNIIVITDGVPTDDPEGVILQCAKRLDHFHAPPYQMGI